MGRLIATPLFNHTLLSLLSYNAYTTHAFADSPKNLFNAVRRLTRCIQMTKSVKVRRSVLSVEPKKSATTVLVKMMFV